MAPLTMRLHLQKMAFLLRGRKWNWLRHRRFTIHPIPFGPAENPLEQSATILGRAHHQCASNSDSQGSQAIPLYHNKRHEYHTRIRKLHEPKDQCLHAHQTTYFYEDVEDFLTRASIPQMRSYLHSYEPVIRRSIDEATRTPSRPLFQFPGFIRRLQQPRRHP